eukprot:scaffold119116_cov60-Phaeocystis_antarctica.AAC.1
MVAIMVTLCCALMVHVRARPVDLGNLVFDAPNRLEDEDEGGTPTPRGLKPTRADYGPPGEINYER